MSLHSKTQKLTTKVSRPIQKPQEHPHESRSEEPARPGELSRLQWKFRRTQPRLTMRYVHSPFDAHRAPGTEAAPTFAPAASAPVTRSAWLLERSNPSSALEKIGSDNECLSTTGTIQEQSFSHARRLPQQEQRGESRPFFGFALPSAFPKPGAAPIYSEQTANNGAAENCSGRVRVSRWLLPPPPFRPHAASAPPGPAPPQSLSLSR